MRFHIVALLILLVLTSPVFADHNLAIGTQGCPIADTNHCVSNAFCPSEDFLVNGQRVARRTECTAQFVDYVRCNGNEPENRRNEQCTNTLGVPDPSQPAPDPNLPTRSSNCLPASITNVNGRSLTPNQYYCLPTYRASTGNEECYNDEQCAYGICAVASFTGAQVCMPNRIEAGASCYYDQQCFSYSAEENPDACAGEDRVTSIFEPGTCRQRPGAPNIYFTIRSDLFGNIDGTPEATDAREIAIYSGENVELNWNIFADTQNSGPVTCTGTSNPAGLWNYQLINHRDDFGPSPLLWRPENPHKFQIDSITQRTEFTFSCTNTRSPTPVTKTIVVDIRGPKPSCDIDANSCLLLHYNFEQGEIGCESSITPTRRCAQNKLGNFEPLGIIGTPRLEPLLTVRGPHAYTFTTTNMDGFTKNIDFTRPDFVNGYSISFWTYRPSTAPSFGTLLFLTSTLNGFGSPSESFVELRRTGPEQFTLIVNNEVSFFTTSFSTLNNLDWHNIVLSATPTSSGFTYRVFVNGNLKFVKNVISSSQRRPANILQFKSDANNKIDDVRIYKTPLTLNQIETLLTQHESVPLNSINIGYRYCTGLPLNANFCGNFPQTGIVRSTLLASCNIQPCVSTCKPEYRPEGNECVSINQDPPVICTLGSYRCNQGVRELCSSQGFGYVTSDCPTGQMCIGDGVCQSSSQTEICTDNIDNDADTRIDCLDSDCSSTQACSSQSSPTYEVGDVDANSQIDLKDILLLVKLHANDACVGGRYNECSRADIDQQNGLTEEDVLRLVDLIIDPFTKR